MPNKLDELDLKIIRTLQIDPRTSITELAEKAESSRPTTTKRLGRRVEPTRLERKSRVV